MDVRVVQVAKSTQGLLLGLRIDGKAWVRFAQAAIPWDVIRHRDIAGAILTELQRSMPYVDDEEPGEPLPLDWSALT